METPHITRVSSSKSQGKLLITSETGRVLSHRLQGTLSDSLINVDLVDTEEYCPDDLPKESLILIIASLRKDERISRPTQVVAQWLSQRAADSNQQKLMKACRFCVFGVGPQARRKWYNNLGRHFSICMRSLGASEILPLEEADQESEKLDEVFSCWSTKLVSNLKANITSDVCNEEMPYICVEGLKFDEYNEDGDHLYETAASTFRTATTENEDKIMAHGANVYVLLEHTDDNPSEKSDACSVTSLYRISVTIKLKRKRGRFSQPLYFRRREDPTFDAQPLGRPIFCFSSDKYPSGMGCGALGRKLFFVGGGFGLTKSAAKDGLSAGHSNKIYILDTSSIESSTVCDDISKFIQIKDSINLNKYDPIVEVVQGKIFVLPNNFGSNGTNPTIESYDPIEDKWKVYDIFKNYKGCGALRTHPSLSRKYKVQAHFVKGFTIFICLRMETYAFNVNTGSLYLVGRRNPTWKGLPFRGNGVYFDGRYIAVDCKGGVMLSFKYNPFLGDMGEPPLFHGLPHVSETSQFYADNVHGLVSHFGDNRGEKRLLVARTGYCIRNAQLTEEAYLVLDFIRARHVEVLEECLYQCRIYHSVLKHVDYPYASNIGIKACFTMPFELSETGYEDTA